MNRCKIITGLFLCIFLFRSSLMAAGPLQKEEFSAEQSAGQATQTPSLKIGERFTYTLSWGIVPAGYATMEVDSLIRWAGGVNCYQIKMFTSTNPFLDKIHKVRDSVISLIETSLKRSHYYRKEQREGSFSRDDELTIDYQNEEVTLNRNGKLKNIIKIQKDEDLLDPYAVLYYVRSLDLEVGDQISVRVIDGNDVYQIQINVLKRERVKSWAGYFDCLKVEPKMEKVEGVFNKKVQAKLYVWLTDDDRKIPVKMQSEVLIGSISGLLKEIHEPWERVKIPKNLPERTEKVSGGY
ncbi:MAG: DUF3108 domain-containing protein [bacterium]